MFVCSESYLLNFLFDFDIIDKKREKDRQCDAYSDKLADAKVAL